MPGDVCESNQVATIARPMSDEDLLSVIARTTAVIAIMEKVRIVASGVAASRSTREHGHSGLAQSNGHRTPVELVQQLTGMSRAGAAKQVRLGESVLAAAEGYATDIGNADEPGGVGADGSLALAPENVDAGARPGAPWHACLGGALLTGRITSDQHDAILRGLGEPAVHGDDAWAVDGDAAKTRGDAVEAWAAAAEQLPHRLALQYAWRDAPPPRKRFAPAA